MKIRHIVFKSQKKRAWYIAITAVVIAVFEAVALIMLMPLKTVEPFVIRVDNNNGNVDVVSTLTETAGAVREEAQDVLDKYWIGQYIRHREGYRWETRDYSRHLIGLMSGSHVQQDYAVYTNPKENPQAPVVLYGRNAQVNITVKAVSMINTEMVDGVKHVTALVRYAKESKKLGERSHVTHWAATMTYVYLNASMDIKDRQLNPLGFQVVSYRNDQESIGG